MKIQNISLSSLTKHLIFIVILKVVILYSLWGILMRPYKVVVTPKDINHIYNLSHDHHTR